MRHFLFLTSFLLLCATTSIAAAQSVMKLPVQGLIASEQGTPLEGSRFITFSLYRDAQATEPLWQETQEVTLKNGLFSVFLGQSQDLDAELFASNSTIHLAMTVRGDQESSRLPFGSVPYAASAQFAQDAATVGGKRVDELTQNATGTAYDNVASGLSATQTQAALDELAARLKALESGGGGLDARVVALEGVGAKGRLEALEQSSMALAPRVDAVEQTVTTLNQSVQTASTQISALTSQVAGLNTQTMANATAITSLQGSTQANAAALTSVQSRLGMVETAQLADSMRIGAVEAAQTSLSSAAAALGIRASALEARAGTLETKAAALETKTMSMSADAANVYFSGVNLHVRSGAGTTNATVNGLGNMIIGYNDMRPSGNVRTGSHNLVLGTKNNFSHSGGYIGGDSNQISATYASVFAGFSNTASGTHAAILTGSSGTASGSQSAILTGQEGAASNTTSAIVSGFQTKASGFRSSVLGGSYGEAAGTYTTIGGGSSLTNSTYSRMQAQGTIVP